MKLTLGHNDAFECPEGKYRGILERVGEPKKPINKPCRSQVRMTYRVETTSGKEHLVARTFCADLSYGSELHNFLDSWLGQKLESLADGDKSVDLKLLINCEADLLITHCIGKGHLKPFANIAGAFPPGTLIEAHE